MNRELFMKKHDAVIKLIAIENNVDMGVATDMLISSIKGHNGDTYEDGNGVDIVFDIYAGIPDSFDWEQATRDYHELTR